MEENSMPEMKLSPVGFVRNNLKESLHFSQANDLKQWQEMVARSRAAREAISEIVIRDDLNELLDGVEDFSHLLVLYWGHRIPEERRSSAKVHPMGRHDLPLVGIFATRSPARPNPILATTVRLVERRGNVLRVQGLDAVDGSPVIDLKPDTPYYQAKGEITVSDWMRRIHEELGDD
jgi:tRNA-Thr(GGU) m(6)t(6)A37 methyltransferase TsaA